MSVAELVSHSLTVCWVSLVRAPRWTLALTLVGVVIFWHCLKLVYLVFFHPLSSVPGPFGAQISYRWQQYHAARLQKARAIQAAHSRYGPIIRIGPNEVSFSDPGLLKSVYGNGVPVLKTEFYDGGRVSAEQNVFTMRIREQHLGRRKLMARNYAQAPLMELAPQILRKMETMVVGIEQQSKQSASSVDLYPLLHRFALETVIMQALGRDPTMIDQQRDHPVLKELEIFQVTFAWMSAFPFLRKFGTRVPLKSIREPFVTMESWVNYTLDVIAEERAKSPRERAPFIGRIMDSPDEYLGRQLTDLEFAEEIISLLFAGSGTTANTLAFLFYAVAVDRTVYDKLKDELKREIPDWPGNDSLPTSGSLPSVSLVQTLPYTNAVILEALRRYPAIPSTMPRIVTSSNLKLGNLDLPKNTIVGAQNFSLHFDDNYFPDPERFDPDRFLSNNSEKQHKARDGLNPFSEGPRACLGRNLAMLEMQIVVALFFRYFDCEVDPSMVPEDMRMKDGFSGCPASQKVLLKLSRSSW